MPQWSLSFSTFLLLLLLVAGGVVTAYQSKAAQDWVLTAFFLMSVATVLTACGGGNSGSGGGRGTSSNSTGTPAGTYTLTVTGTQGTASQTLNLALTVGSGGGSTAGQAQGVYSGTASSGYAFDTIVLPNDKFYAIYGTISGNVFSIFGMITGQGTSGSSTYTAASVTDFFYTGLVNSGSVTASYMAGSSLNGTLTENGVVTTLSGTALPASVFNYNAPASISAISGTWTGQLLGGVAATVTISSNGSLSGSSSGCLFSGTVAADSSNKNFFDVTMIFGSSPCVLPNQTASGIGINYLLSDGKTHQLLGAVTEGTSAGTVFAAQR
jgi:hypothetical protein